MMPSLSHELLEQAKAGQEPAIARVIAQMMPLIRSAAQSCITAGLEFDDAVQEGLIGLFGAIRSFSPDVGVPFESYAAACVRNAQRSARRAAQRKKHGPLNNSVPLPEDELLPGPEQQLLEQEAYAATLDRLSSSLTALERSVLVLHLRGETIGSIAAVLSIPPKSAENALGRVRRKLKSGVISQV